MDPRVLVICAGIAAAYLGGHAIVKATKKAGHAVSHAVVRVVHHPKKPANPPLQPSK